MKMLHLEPGLDYVHWLNRDLAISSVAEAEAWPALRELGICGVVDVSDGAADIGWQVRSQGIRYLRLSVAHGRLPAPEELHIVASWMLQRLCEDGPVLVYEAEGRGNHALVACAALIRRGANVRRASVQLRRASWSELSDAHLDVLERFVADVAAALVRR
jgi:hypothetical protein